MQNDDDEDFELVRAEDGTIVRVLKNGRTQRTALTMMDAMHRPGYRTEEPGETSITDEDRQQVADAFGSYLDRLHNAWKQEPPNPPSAKSDDKRHDDQGDLRVQANQAYADMCSRLASAWKG